MFTKGETNMRIGVPKEIKNNENRVGLTPSGVLALVKENHEVVIEYGAGVGSGYLDEDYKKAGAKLSDVFDTWNSDMVVKVKEPLKTEYQYFKKGMILFTYLHLAAEEALTRELLAKEVTAIAYETVQLENRSLPLLTPMSEVAGKRAVIVAASILEKHHGGSGLLIGGVTGTRRGKIVIIGGGMAGISAAKVAIGIGARVTIFDVNLDRLRYMDDVFGDDIQTMYSTEYDIHQELKDADVCISTVLIPGAKAPKVVKEYMVQDMKPGSVIIDVAIDQGGSVETMDRVTTHDNPTFVKHGVVHYSVANMPGATPSTSTAALTSATMPYIIQVANHGIDAIRKSKALKLGLNTIQGKLVYKAVAETFDIEYTDLEDVL